MEMAREAVPFLIERLSETPFRNFLSKNSPHYLDNLDFVIQELVKVQRFMRWRDFKQQSEDRKQALIRGLKLTVRKVGKYMGEIHAHYLANRSINLNDGTHKAIDELVKEWGDILSIIAGIVYCCYKLTLTKAEKEFALEEVYGENFEGLERIDKISVSLDDPNKWLNEQESVQLFLLKAFPVLTKKSENLEKKTFLLGLSKELDNLPQLICMACHGLPLALVLVGSLLSLKETISDIWKKVKDELYALKNEDKILSNIMNYCYEDLPSFIKPCFLYLACYPEGYEIPSRSLINIWVAEGFISKKKEEETAEETAYKYLEQLVERSLVHVSKRSFFGSIKYCCVNRVIHKFVINQSKKEGFLDAKPDERTSESLFRVAIHTDNKSDYGKLDITLIRSFVAINVHQNILRNSRFLIVLELSRSTVPDEAISNMICLRYLGLRHTSIDTLPDSIDVMHNLETLDVRNTNIKSLPESLWKISTLRHVYVVATPEIKGPPPTANLTDLQTLKTVAVPQSWIDIYPHFLTSLRKLSLSNPDGLDWKSVSNLLSQLVNLFSLTIMGNSVPSEFIDTRAFPGLKTVKSIRLGGQWSYRKLFMDNVEVPPNLSKLTLNKSSLKEDPMPWLERIKTLKFLRLQDGAYTGKQMKCSAKGFPQLEYLELSKLETLEKWVVEAEAMSELRTLRVIQCNKLKDLPKREHGIVFLDT
ncbi:inactive disease susceptibility protein LOV1-like [Carex rostrata]